MDLERIPLQTQTLYAELLERLQAREAHRSIGRAAGCFTTKTVKGESYYYFQYSDPGGRQRQAYVGRKTPELDKIVARFLKDRESLQPEEDQIQILCAQIRMGGALMTDAVSGRVLKALADGAFFHLDGVLVGTHAFTVLGNMLGVRWRGGAMKTQDVDLAGNGALQVALTDAQADVPKILESIQMGFIPIPALNPKHPSTSFAVRGSSLRVDILTPEIGAPKKKPVLIRRFNVAAQPLRFLDYLLEAPLPGAVIDGGGIFVNVPQPARFAFHKLITSQERAAAMHTKTEKDIRQASQVFLLLCEERPEDVRLAWDDLKARGTGWAKRIVAAMKRVKKLDSSTHGMILEIIPELSAGPK